MFPILKSYLCRGFVEINFVRKQINTFIFFLKEKSQVITIQKSAFCLNNSNHLKEINDVWFFNFLIQKRYVSATPNSCRYLDFRDVRPFLVFVAVVDIEIKVV